MSYTDPHHVGSPKSSVSELMPVYDGGEGDFAVTLMKWDGQDAVAIRWNGGSKDNAEDHTKRPHPGNPQSRGLPTWFVLPEILDVAILQALLENALIGGGSIDKSKAEEAIRRAIPLLGGNGETQVKTDKLEGKILTIIEKLKSEGKI